MALTTVVSGAQVLANDADQFRQLLTGAMNDQLLTFKYRDAGTTTVVNVVTVGHNSSGTPAANFGVGVKFTGQSSTTADRDMAAVQVYWTTATDASRAAAIDLQTVTGAGALTTRWTVQAAGHLVAGADNSYDIGASGATRPRTVYVGTSVVVGGVTIASTGNQITAASGDMSVLGGSGGGLLLGGAGSQHWKITSSGHLTAVLDNAYDIGASGATRPRNVYIGGDFYSPTSVVLGSAAKVGFGGAYIGFQLGGNANIQATSATSTSGSFDMNQNAYFDGTNWKYISTAAATNFEGFGGEYYFRVAASGTAGNNITWSTAWKIGNAGHLTAGTDNAYDIGASGATRPRTGYFATKVDTPLVGYSTTGVLQCNAQFKPETDNSRALGDTTTPLRWSQVCAVSGTIQTSHSDYKNFLGGIDTAEALRVARSHEYHRFTYKGDHGDEFILNYKHVGIKAEHAHEWLSPDGQTVNAQTTACVALAAVAGEADVREAETAALRREIAELTRRLDRLGRAA